MRTKDGSWKHILGRGKAVRRDANGRATRMIGTHVDITARKQAEAALQEAHDELERRVEERTAELRGTNAELSREIDRARKRSRLCKPPKHATVPWWTTRPRPSAGSRPTARSSSSTTCTAASLARRARSCWGASGSRRPWPRIADDRRAIAVLVARQSGCHDREPRVFRTAARSCRRMQFVNRGQSTGTDGSSKCRPSAATSRNASGPSRNCARAATNCRPSTTACATAC